MLTTDALFFEYSVCYILTPTQNNFVFKTLKVKINRKTIN